MQVNQATGEVTATLAGETFRFHATLPRVAAFQSALGHGGGLTVLFMRVQEGDAAAIYHGLRTLCSSENTDRFDSLITSRVLGEAMAALLAALAAGLPEGTKQKKDGAAGKSSTT
jgi:hypothetical protein